MKIVVPLLPFTDAQEMQRRHPSTFSAPTGDEIKGLRTKSYVKVCAGRERFWVQIIGIAFDDVDPHKTVFRGRVDNDLAFKSEHGLDYNDLITFEGRHIYSTEVP